MKTVITVQELHQARDIRSPAAICNALGFGGHNTSVVVGRFEG